MLDVFSTSDPAGLVYRHLLLAPFADEDTLAERTELPIAQVRDLLGGLEAERLIVATAQGWEPLSPELAAARLQDEHHRAMTRIQSVARELQETAARTRRSGSLPGMRLLHDRQEIYDVMIEQLRHCTKDVLLVERPPYYSDDSGSKEQDEILAVQLDRMAAGVVYRTVYDNTVLANENYMSFVVAVMAEGERVRTMSAVPVKFLIVDREFAAIELDTSRDNYEGGLLILEPSALVDWLVLVFESMWTLAVPVADGAGDAGAGAAATGGLQGVDRSIVELMALGATDDAIARRLGLSRRTVVRRVAAVMRQLGADNRFQAGIQASRRGLL